MASGSGQGSSTANAAKEYRVRAPPVGPKKTFCITKFSNVDLKNFESAKIERENNLKQYKLSHDMDVMPKFGAGSEFGREQREEARRKKFGVKVKTYNPGDQPFVLKLGSGKQSKRYKGSREGGIGENASYYIFLQCPDGAFQFMPVSEWYKFTPVSKYKCLNSEEAEEEFDRRDRTLNYFSIMVRKRLKHDEDAATEADAEDGAKKGGDSKKKKKSKDFMLTELDEWANMTDASDDDSAASGEEAKPKKKKQVGGKKKSKKRKANSDDEAMEESDDMNEGEEVDYMTDSDSADDAMYDDKARDDANSKYEEKGVEDEDGLRKMVGSEDEEEEEQKDEEEEEKETEEGKKEASDSESSSGSDSDSDPEKDSTFASALFMQSKDSSKKKSKSSSQQNLPSNDGTTSSHSSTPSNLNQSKGKKRKAESEGQTAKKPKTEPIVTASSSDGVMQEAVKRYLMRKPMTTTDLIQKFKSKNTGLTKDQLVTTIAQILKQLNPERSKNKDKLFLFIRKTDH